MLGNEPRQGGVSNQKEAEWALQLCLRADDSKDVRLFRILGRVEAQRRRQAGGRGPGPGYALLFPSAQTLTV